MAASSTVEKSKPAPALLAMRLATACASLLVTCLVLELGLRMLRPVGLHATDTYLARASEKLGKAGTLRLVPHARTRDQSPEFNVAVQINSHGLRDREFSYRKPAGTYRVLVLGDSQTFGVGVEAEETYSKVLERRLRDATGRSVEVINTGVPGTGTAHQLYFLEIEGWRYEPDAVVTGFFFNDVNNNRLCDLYALRGGRLVRSARTELDDAGEPAQRSQAHGGLIAYHTPVRARPPAPSFWIRHSHLARFIRERLSRYDMKDARADQIAEGVAAWDLTAHLFRELSRRCAERRAVCLVTMIPSLMECKFRSLARVEAANAPLLRPLKPQEVLDLHPRFRAAGGERLFFARDQHMNREGHRVTGEAIARKLLAVDPALRRK